MADNREQLNALKKAFEAGTRKAPEGVWSNISGRMDQDAPKDVLRDKVAESFNTYQKAAPNHVWQGVNRQLNIDRTWSSLKNTLDGYSMRKRFMRYAAVLLLLITLSWISAEYFELFAPAGTNMKDAPASDIVSGLQDKNYPEKPKVATTETSEVTKKSVSPEKSEEKLHSKFASAAGNVNSLAVEPASNLIAQNIPVAKILAVPAEIPAANPASVSHFSTMPPVVEEKKAQQTGNRFGVGLIYGFNKTKLLNNETRISEDAYSLISSSPAYAGSYGITARYAITKHGTLHGAFYLGDRVKQNYSTYVKGIYTQKEMVLDYRKIAFSYQHNLFDIPATSISTYIRGGAYQAWQTEASVKINAAEKPLEGYAAIDNGITLQVGQQAGRGNWKISYGINFEQGSNNIFSGGPNLPAHFNITKTQRVGAFTEVFYSF